MSALNHGAAGTWRRVRYILVTQFNRGRDIDDTAGLPPTEL